MTYYPLSIWLQPVANFGEESGPPRQSANPHLLHAWVGDYIENPWTTTEDGPECLRGEWVVDERNFSEVPQSDSPDTKKPYLTLYIRRR